MKKEKKYIFLLLLFAFVAIGINAQNEFAPIGAMWHYDFSVYGDYGHDYIAYISEKDTVVNGKDCKIIQRVNNAAYREIMHEEDGKVYYWYDGKFRKIYDFSVNIGESVLFEVKSNKRYSTAPIDSVISINCLVTDISYVNAGDTPLKVITVSISEDDKPDFFTEWPDSYTYYEKIGNMNNSFLFQISTTVSPAIGSPMQLRCYNDADVTYTTNGWASKNKPCDYKWESSTRQQEINEWRVSPNPVIDNFAIEIPYMQDNLDFVIELYDLAGNRVLKTHLTSSKQKIYAESLMQGMYILTVNDGLNRSKNFKIIKL